MFFLLKGGQIFTTLHLQGLKEGMYMMLADTQDALSQPPPLVLQCEMSISQY